MSRPGIVLAYSGLDFAAKRLEGAMDSHYKKPDGATEANVVRALCESLFWLFALNESFDVLISNKTPDDIHLWWSKQGKTGRQMNALRFIRNRITHSHLHYWDLIDHNTLKWIHVAAPTQTELAGPAGKYVPKQYQDFMGELEGEPAHESIRAVANLVLETIMKLDVRSM